MKTENTTINKETAEQNNGLHPIEDTLEGLGVEKKERRRFIKALRNLVSQEIREALKAMWEDINKRFEQVNHRFEMMEVRFKELGERLDRHEERMDKRMEKHEKTIKEILQTEVSAIKELLTMEKEANEKRHRTTIWVFGTAITVMSAVLGLLSTLIALNLTNFLN